MKRPFLMVLLLSIWLLCIQLGYARLISRSSADTTPIIIPLSRDASQRYVVTVDMSDSPTPQSFPFALSTGTGYTIVAGDGCQNCAQSSSYNISRSSSAVYIGDNQAVQLGDGWASGPMIKETCAFKTSNGSMWTYKGQPILMANTSSSMFSSDISGVVGLGTNGQSGQNLSNTFLGTVSDKFPSADRFFFAMDLNKPDPSSTSGGELHLLAPVQSSFTGSINWNDVVDSSVDGIDEAGWTLQLDNFTFSSGGNTISNTRASSVVLDPYFPAIYLPLAEANIIYADVSGAALQAGSSNISDVWAVPCSTQMTFAATIGGETYTLDQSILITQYNGTCISALQGWNNASVTSYIFGSTFISSVYLMFNASLPGSTSSNSIGIAMRPAADQKADTAVIVAATLGSLSFICFIGLSAFLFYRSRQRKKRMSQDSTIRDSQIPLLQTPPSVSSRTDFALLYSPTAPGGPAFHENRGNGLHDMPLGTGVPSIRPNRRDALVETLVSPLSPQSPHSFSGAQGRPWAPDSDVNMTPPRPTGLHAISTNLRSLLGTPHVAVTPYHLQQPSVPVPRSKDEYRQQQGGESSTSLPLAQRESREASQIQSTSQDVISEQSHSNRPSDSIIGGSTITESTAVGSSNQHLIPVLVYVSAPTPGDENRPPDRDGHGELPPPPYSSTQQLVQLHER